MPSVQLWEGGVWMWDRGREPRVWQGQEKKEDLSLASRAPVVIG